MTVKTIEFVSLTTAEWELLEKALQLLEDIAFAAKVEMDIKKTAIEAASALQATMEEVIQIQG